MKDSNHDPRSALLYLQVQPWKIVTEASYSWIPSSTIRYFMDSTISCLIKRHNLALSCYEKDMETYPPGFYIR